MRRAATLVLAHVSALAAMVLICARTWPTAQDLLGADGGRLWFISTAILLAATYLTLARYAGLVAREERAERDLATRTREDACVVMLGLLSGILIHGAATSPRFVHTDFALAEPHLAFTVLACVCVLASTVGFNACRHEAYPADDSEHPNP